MVPRPRAPEAGQPARADGLHRGDRAVAASGPPCLPNLGLTRLGVPTRRASASTRWPASETSPRGSDPVSSFTQQGRPRPRRRVPSLRLRLDSRIPTGWSARNSSPAAHVRLAFYVEQPFEGPDIQSEVHQVGMEQLHTLAQPRKLGCELSGSEQPLERPRVVQDGSDPEPPPVSLPPKPTELDLEPLQRLSQLRNTRLVDSIDHPSYLARLGGSTGVESTGHSGERIPASRVFLPSAMRPAGVVAGARTDSPRPGRTRSPASVCVGPGRR